MFEIREIENIERHNTKYHKGYESLNPHIVTHNKKVMAYLWFRHQGERIQLNMIEVVEKRKGVGESVIEFLFNHYGIDEINGFVLCEVRAYDFWRKLGASIYHIDVEGYEDGEELVDAGIESPFSLTKDAFSMYRKAKDGLVFTELRAYNFWQMLGGKM